LLPPPPLAVHAALGHSAAVAVVVIVTQPKPLAWQPAGAPLAGVLATMELSTLRKGVFTHDVAVSVKAVLVEFGENCSAELTTSFGFAWLKYAVAAADAAVTVLVGVVWATRAAAKAAESSAACVWALTL
jgi:hypothetical protein